MQVWGVPDFRIGDIVRDVSDKLYAGNVTYGSYAGIGDQRTRTVGRAVALGLRVRDSHGPGARLSRPTVFHSQRHLIAACWHVWRDVLEALFEQYPDARVKTAMADYRGAGDFALEYRATYWRNAGSAFEPAPYGTLCECES